jgi:hypothetical protein
LGPEFEPIQNNFRVRVLPSELYNEDWPTNLALCRDYYNSVRPQSIFCRDAATEFSGDQLAHQKKIKEWWLDLTKYCQLIEAEQQKHQGKCLYHLTKSHQTSNCAVKKECDHTLASKQTCVSGASSSSTGQLRHITEDCNEEAIDDSCEIVDQETNDTNDEVLHYVAHVTNHYLHLVKGNPALISRHDMQYPIIADSGANCHMFQEIEFFESLLPASGKVILGDGKTSLDIKGIRTVNLHFDGHEVKIQEVCYILDLAESIYCLFLHIQCPTHGLHSLFDAGLHIEFPTFTTKAVLGQNDIYLNAVPSQSNATSLSIFSIDIPSNTICRHVTQPDRGPIIEPTGEDNILRQLRKFYQEVKHKRQLNLDVPAGFRKCTDHQCNLHHFLYNILGDDWG